MDEGTETIAPGETRLRAPSFWRDTSLLRKFVIYASAFETKAHVSAFGIPVFRIVTVAKTPSRITAMKKACNHHLKNVRAGLFLFADWQQIVAHEGSMLTFPFCDSENRCVVLLKPDAA